MYLRGFLIALSLTAALSGARPDLHVNNSTGSDTTASGAPTGLSPISAAATCHTNGIASTTIQWLANGLSGAGVPTDGSALIWLNTASGRQWSRITGLAVNTVTVEDSFNIPLLSAVNCAVGGQRSSLTPQMIADLKQDNATGTALWIVSIEHTGTPYDVTAQMTSAAKNTAPIVRGIKSGAGVRPVIRTTTSGIKTFSGQLTFISLEFQNNAAPKTNSIAIERVNAPAGNIIDCIIGGTTAGDSFETGIYNNAVNGVIAGNLIRNNTEGFYNFFGGVFLASNVFDSNGQHYRDRDRDVNGGTMLIFRNLFLDATDDAIQVDQGVEWICPLWIEENTFDGNVNGIHIVNPTGWLNAIVVSNIFSNHTGIAMWYDNATLPSQNQRQATIWDYNVFFNNSTDVTNIVKGSHSFTADPGYTDRAGGDYSVTNDALVCWPPGSGDVFGENTGATTTPSAITCGAVKGVGGGSGGGGGGNANISP